MRLHRLTVQAFGPFADRQEVDFDSLNECGVFLLAGPTGSGKTSVLDAICFALYGAVPGDREVRRLRSDHAAPDVPPRVQLELTLADRRLRVERWPEWRRPKKRGEGTTTEHAGARLFEVGPDGGERLLSSRVQEVGHELGPLLGMTCDQFKQVVLLPQGGFQTFLKATSDERRAVLEKLFATQRFTRIESWVHERAGELRGRADQACADVVALMRTIGHRSGRPVPDELRPEVLTAWRSEVLTAAADAAASAREAEAAARAEALRAKARHRAVADAHALARRRHQAERVLAELEDTMALETDATARLDDHRRAAAVVSVIDTARESEAALADARRRAQQAVDPLGTEVGLDECVAAAAELQQRIGELQALEEVAVVLRDAESRAERLQLEHDTVVRDLGAQVSESAALPAQRDGLVARLAEARSEVGRRDERDAALQRAQEQQAAARELPAAREGLEELTRAALAAHQRANAARELHLDLVERRLLGMAAELAGQLSEGTPCQVCGSLHHPHPTTAATDAVTDEQQHDAAAAAESARGAHEDLQRRLADAQRRVDSLEAASGGRDAAEAGVALEEAVADLARSEQAVAEVAALERELDALQSRVEESSQRLDRLRTEREGLAEALAGAREVVARNRPQVEGVVGGHASVESAVGAAADRLRLVQAAATALADLGEAERQHAACQRRGEQAATGAGFTELDDVRAAVLDRADEQRLEELLAARAEARAQARGVLLDHDVQALATADVGFDDDDLALAARHEQEAAGALETAVSELRSAEERHAALVALADQLDGALEAWLPVREEHELAHSLSQLVRGTGGDNQLQMRLSSYVLATRLDQVLDAANERLHQMRDRRFTLHRAARARAGRGRSGLDLEVLDDWTGETRPPSTLSGGETFKISLALALGLADVITHEAGGLRIETLFVDEGFGMLDADTLDEVMDCIDELRSGGRSVGVVSHVSELRARIGSQLQVTSSPRGSRLSLSTTPA